MRDSVGRTGRFFYSCCVWLALLAAPGLGAFAEDCNRNGVEDDLVADVGLALEVLGAQLDLLVLVLLAVYLTSGGSKDISRGFSMLFRRRNYAPISN